ncbi:MAG: lysine exporter LysO family protein [Firmicutes bacterium]|nr:lysine exporter LysO family protein [Bacillota bacterium]
MSDLILYLSLAVVGYFVGSKLPVAEKLQKLTNPLQTIAMIVIIFSMSMRMGANEEVMSNLNSIGLYGFIMTIAIVAGSVLSMVLARMVFHMDRDGNFLRYQEELSKAPATTDQNEVENAEAEPEKKGISTTTIIVVCVVGGLLFGWLFGYRLFEDVAQFDRLGGTLIRIGLCTMLALIGFDMGVEGTVIENFKRAGWRVMAFPFFIMAGTLIAAGLCSFFMPITLREGLAIGAGFGWYSFAPAAIMERGHITAGAISFMHNIIREYISVLTIPIVSKRIGYLEGMSVCGCSAMDVCLPIIERSTKSDIAVYAFISGAVQSMAVPILVPLFIG